MVQCGMAQMSPETVRLDADVTEELRELAERSGRPLDSLANAALRDYVRYEREVLSSIERGVTDLGAGRTRTTEQVMSLLAERRRGRSPR